VAARRRLAAAVALAVTLGPVACTDVRAPLLGSAASRVAAPSPAAAAPQPRRQIIGRSVQGRPLLAYTLGSATASRRVLVIGCIHGDEPAGIGPALALLRAQPGPGVEVVVVPDANPDGWVHGTRQNARGVDLNRNFPYAWRQLGRRGDQQYSGTGPLSEPESSALAALVRRVRPTVTVWFHQPLGLVDLSGGSVATETRFARLAGLGLRQLPRYPGSATGWQNHGWPGSTAFVVELPRPAGAAALARVLSALRDLER
jgi:protein MpaA